MPLTSAWRDPTWAIITTSRGNIKDFQREVASLANEQMNIHYQKRNDPEMVEGKGDKENSQHAKPEWMKGTRFVKRKKRGKRRMQGKRLKWEGPLCIWCWNQEDQEVWTEAEGKIITVSFYLTATYSLQSTQHTLPTSFNPHKRPMRDGQEYFPKWRADEMEAENVM